MRNSLVTLILLFTSSSAFCFYDHTKPLNHGFDDTIKGLDKVLAAYVSQTGAQSEIYYGIEHMGYSSKIEGVAYFENIEWQKGTVVYNGILYSNVSLKYDLVADELIVLHPNNYFGVTLIKDKVNSFTISGHSFIALPKNNKYALAPGFYEQMATGQLTILSKRSRKIEEKIINGEVKRRFIDDYEYYAIKNGSSYRITNESSMMDILDEKAKKVRSYLKDKGIVFKNMKEAALLEIAAYYNQSSE